MDEFEDSDEYCPHCDNHFGKSPKPRSIPVSKLQADGKTVIEAKEPKARLEVEGDDVRIDSRMLKDDRVKPKEEIRVWDDEGEAARLG